MLQQPRERPAWADAPPRWYLWDGGFLIAGRSVGVVPPHAHHAIQITVAVEGSGRLRAQDGDWLELRGAIVQPDVIHSFDGMHALGIMLFVDPESHEGRWLCQSLRQPVTPVPDARMERIVPEARKFIESPLEAMEPAELIRHVVTSLCAGAPPNRQLDPRVARALEFMREADTPRLSLEEVADTVFLSPSRFAHLFSENVGLPFRRYLLWRKLGRAMLAIGRGVSLSQAAHEAGFADSAHLTRTSKQLAGVRPAMMLPQRVFVAPGGLRSVDNL